MPEPLPLRELQLRLRRLFAGPLPESDDDLAHLISHLPVSGDHRLPPAQRVRIYAGMYFLRLRDALAEDYAALRHALGAAKFDALVRAYVAAHPSDRPSLRDLGRHLPSFVARRPELLHAPWHGDLARFEWAMVEAFDAPDEAVLAATDLEALAAERWPGLRLVPVRSLVVVAAAAPVDTLRERLRADESIDGVVIEPVLLRVWRQDLTVFHRRMDAVEGDALRRIDRGVTFAALCDWLGERMGEDAATAEALRLLGRWIEDGLLGAGACPTGG